MLNFEIMDAVEPHKEEKIAATKKLMDGILKLFIPWRQLAFVRTVLNSEEWEFFADKMAEIAATIERMPKSTAKNQETVYLHYFGGAANWWITGKDFKYKENKKGEQFQAFGKADLFGAGGECEEYGYIGIAEMLDVGGIELDFHWTPKPAKDCGKKG